MKNVEWSYQHRINYFLIQTVVSDLIQTRFSLSDESDPPINVQGGASANFYPLSMELASASSGIRLIMPQLSRAMRSSRR